MLYLSELLNAIAPALHLEGADRLALRGVCIDSRQAQPGSLFVALRGERTDGHAYLADAFRAGAVVALVERLPETGVAVLDIRRGVVPAVLRTPLAVVVPDTLQALQCFAAAHRAALAVLRVVAVTGSLGKTTTKEAIGAVLAARYCTLKSGGNQNNELGLPLTLLTLDSSHQRAVLEMGMYALGEIATLCRLARPEWGVVTNVGPVHLERLGTIERIADAKAELVESLPPSGIAFLNGDDPRVRAMSARTRARVVTFGLNDHNTLWADGITSHGLDGVTFTVHVGRSFGVLQDDRGGQAEVARYSERSEESHPLHLASLGEHAVLAALPAVAVGLCDGLTWNEIETALLALGRGLRLVPKPARGGATLLDDSYNASPASVLAALDALASLPGRHLAVLGDMLELGAYEAEGHRLVGERAARTLDLLVTVGERGKMIAQGALAAGMAQAAVCTLPDNAHAIEMLRQVLQEGDILLIKGSRGMAMEAIVQALEVSAS